uniref:Uncharacterized protein n=1 Tax=Globisporangium ultimum (strain ATCC 200006 / CBS 805.95 / DAOM BR144) TaxID=431595 RepID=K3X435_GLOUD
RHQFSAKVKGTSFNIDKFETTSRKFASEILTDGKSVSVVLRKPKRKSTPCNINLADYDVVWGLDPGRRDLFVATNQLGDKVSCSRREYCEYAHINESNQIIRHWQHSQSDVLEAIRNMPTKKTASLECMKEYVDFMVPRLGFLLTFFVAKPFRKLKLRRFISMQKKLRKMCLQLIEGAGRHTIVGFGDWSNRDVAGLIKKCPSGPVKRFERELRESRTVVPIDEYRTSEVHADCHTPLVYQYC